MNVPREGLETNSPILPRRAFVVAALSAVTAASFISLGVIGGLSRIDQGMFQFTRGLSLAAGQESRLRGFLSDALSDERIQVIILGHTSDAGNDNANLKLSEERAALVRTIAEEMGIASDRITANGVGSSAPLDREEGETDRAFQQRMARVEVALQMRR